VLRLPEHHGEPGKSSIKYDADLVLTKRSTDIVVIGHAYAPPNTTVTHTDVGFKVGPLQKLLRATGDRSWTGSGPTAPQPFQKMALVYERAYGGVDPKSDHPDTDFDGRNPVGTGFVVTADHAAGGRLPNIEDPRMPYTRWNDRPEPAGFGVIASHWQPRVGWAGTYGEHWMKTRQPLLAEDLDDRYFQSAPADQQTQEFLRGGEPVILHRLTPSGRLQFVLPKLYFGFETSYYDGSRELHRNRQLHTVILEPDFPRVSLVWHSALPCHFKVQKLEKTVISLKEDRSLGEAPMDDADLALG
jgi:hypothetical protein